MCIAEFMCMFETAAVHFVVVVARLCQSPVDQCVRMHAYTTPQCPYPLSWLRSMVVHRAGFTLIEIGPAGRLLLRSSSLHRQSHSDILKGSGSRHVYVTVMGLHLSQLPALWGCLVPWWSVKSLAVVTTTEGCARRVKSVLRSSYQALWCVVTVSQSS